MKKLLVVVDMQNDFIYGTLGTKEAVAILRAVTDKVAGFEGDIIYTKDTHTSRYLDTAEGKKLPVQHCIKGTDGWRIEAALEKLFLDKRCECVEKDTFGSSELPLLIRKKYPEGLDEIELIGLCTDICVVSNALILKAFFPETVISVDSECCAGATPQGHKEALDVMRICHIDVR